MTSSDSSHRHLNQVVLSGKVAKPPQFHHQLDGTPVLQFLLELDESNGSSGTPPLQGRQARFPKRAKSSPGLVQIVAKGDLAQSGSLIQNGQRLLVKGRLQERRWKMPDGRQRSRTEVMAFELCSGEENETNLPQINKGKIISIERGETYEKTG